MIQKNNKSDDQEKSKINNTSIEEEKSQSEILIDKEGSTKSINTQNYKKFWKFFWITIILMAIVTIGMSFIGSQNLKELSKLDRKAKVESFISKLQTISPQFKKMTQQLSENSIEDIKRTINSNVEKAYSPLYDQIDDFSDFHYSVKGEYLELARLASGDLKTTLDNELFKPSDFDNKLNIAFKNISVDSANIVKEQLKNMKNTVQDNMGVNDDEINFVFAKILNISQTNMLDRFKSYSNGLGRVAGVSVGAGAGVLMAKLISKKLVTAIAAKSGTKLLVKTGAKFITKFIIGVLGGGTGGAFLSFKGGPIISAVGGIVGAIVGWFAVDKVVILIDKYYNEEKFKHNIRLLIDQQKADTKKTLEKIYIGSIKKLSDNTADSFKNIKNRKIIDNL